MLQKQIVPLITAYGLFCGMKKYTQKGFIIRTTSAGNKKPAFRPFISRDTQKEQLGPVSVSSCKQPIWNCAE